MIEFAAGLEPATPRLQVLVNCCRAVFITKAALRALPTELSELSCVHDGIRTRKNWSLKPARLPVAPHAHNVVG